MEEALRSARNPPSLWYRHGYDTFTKLHCCHVEEFSQHLNSRDPHIKFTLELEEDVKLALPETSHETNPTCSVYRKPTHTDQYLNFNSNHHLENKLSIVHTLRTSMYRVPSDQTRGLGERDQTCCTVDETRSTSLCHTCGAPQKSLRECLNNMESICTTSLSTTSDNSFHTSKRRPNPTAVRCDLSCKM